jgi:hypothetical protein
MFPPVNGGLHCGRPAPCDRMSDARRAPAVRLRAPLRHHRDGPRHPLPERCSCRPTAGSIAAPSRRGWKPTTSRVLPPLQRRAPLRQPGVQRRDRVLQQRAPAARRRAPLRYPPCPGRTPGTVRPPAVLRRPLWLHDGLAAIPDLRAVLPPLDGGLHCGERLESPEYASDPCSRLPLAGSIAACRSRSSWTCSGVATPADEGGLHCGDDILGMNATVDPVSRRSAVGSIEASPRRTSRSSC